MVLSEEESNKTDGSEIDEKKGNNSTVLPSDLLTPTSPTFLQYLPTASTHSIFLQYLPTVSTHSIYPQYLPTASTHSIYPQHLLILSMYNSQLADYFIIF